MVLVVTSVSMTNAQTVLTPEQRSEAVDSIVSQWEDWDTVAINGKLKMAGLALNPSLRIYMQRDSAIFISLRAPFVGEVGRAEITDSTALVVNKMKKIYVEEPLQKVFSFYPGGLADLQDLLLARIALPGIGTLSHEVEEYVDMYAEEDGTMTLVVGEDFAIPGFNYGYVIFGDFLPVALLVLPEQYPDVTVTLTYEYYDKGYDLNFFYRSEKKNYQATLELDDPVWDEKPFDRISLNSKYRKVELQEFLKTF